MDSTNGPIDEAVDLTAPARIPAVINGGVIDDHSDGDAEPLLYGDVNGDAVDGDAGDTAETANDLSSIVGERTVSDAGAMDIGSDDGDLDNGDLEDARGGDGDSDHGFDTASMLGLRRRK